MPRTRAQKDAARRLKVNLEEDLKRKYLEHKRSLEFLANRYDVSPPTVARWLEDLGIQRRPQGRPRKDETFGTYSLAYQGKAA